MLWSEVTIDGSNAITTGGIFVTFIGLVGWILKSALPGLLSDFGERLDKVQADHDHQLTSARTEFRAMLLEYRQDNMAMRKEFLDALAVERESMGKLSTSIETLAAEVRAIKANK